ncbi:hypothetical protein N9N28_08265 [Rubripirellula amarantea]|nr:hypothetical protein [Rubripirellula amarantea]
MNPYESPRRLLPADDRESLSFSGTIEEADYASLLSRRDSEAILYGILFGLLMVMSISFTGLLIYALVNRGWSNLVLPAILLDVVLSLGAVFSWRFFRPLHRARRKLKRNPDLISKAKGRLSQQGFEFYDGSTHYWFGPQQLVHSSVTKTGVRIPVAADPYRFLAITARMIDSYSVDVAMRIKQHWIDQAKVHERDFDEETSSSVVETIFPMPVNAISFRGSISQHQPAIAKGLRNSAIVELVAAMALVGFGYFHSDSHTFMRYGLIAYGLLCLASTVRAWSRYLSCTSMVSWDQQGWIGEHELALLAGSRSAKYSLTKLREQIDHGEVLELQFDAAATCLIARDHFKSEDEWTRVRTFCSTGNS